MTDRTCSIEGCGKPRRKRGWCEMHYQRWRRYGDPMGDVPPEPKGGPPAERFWAKVAVTPSCWLWTACTDGKGYGLFTLDGRTVRVHRWSYEQLVGPIPEGLVTDHLCRVHNCVNPAHLEPVTSRENSLRGRNYQSEKTCCKRGHPFDEANTRLPSNGQRECRACNRDRARERRRLRKAEHRGTSAD